MNYRLDTISESIGGTGVSPVQAQAKACGYHKLIATRHEKSSSGRRGRRPDVAGQSP